MNAPPENQVMSPFESNKRKRSMPDLSISDNDYEVQIRRGSDIAPKAMGWLWEEWLAVGKLTILAGEAGTNKSTLALGIGATVTTGGTWPDGSSCNRKGNVLVWSSEDDADDTSVPRLWAAGADMSYTQFICGVSQRGQTFPFDPSRDIALLQLAVEKMGGASLLIIDPIVSAVSGDMHRANDVRRSLQAVTDFAKANQCAVIGITHFTKGSGEKTPSDRVIGSQAFSAQSRMVWVVAKEQVGNRRVLARAKSNIAPDDGGFEYTYEVVTLNNDIRTIRTVWGEKLSGSAREILAKIEPVIHEKPKKPREDIAELLLRTLADCGGRMPSSAVEKVVVDAGFNFARAERLKKNLGIESEKSGMHGGWDWVLRQSEGAR